MRGKGWRSLVPLALRAGLKGGEWRPTPVWDRGHCRWVDIIFQDAAVLNGVSTGTGLRRCHHADSGGQNRGSERESQDAQGSRVSQGCGRSHPKAISPHQVRTAFPSHADLEKALGGPSVWRGDRSQGPVSKYRKVTLSLQLCRYD